MGCPSSPLIEAAGATYTLSPSFTSPITDASSWTKDDLAITGLFTSSLKDVRTFGPVNPIKIMPAKKRFAIRLPASKTLTTRFMTYSSFSGIRC